MATSTAIKFFKGGYGSAEALNISTVNAGAIVFDNTSHQIYVGGVAYGGNITDVTFENSMLTISKAIGSDVKLDFSDTASATATFQVFQHLNALIGTATTDENLTAEYAGTHYLTSATNLIGADKALDTAIYDLGTRIDNLNGSATIATVNDNVVTLKVGVTETGGIISNTAGTDITLAEVAVTGAAEDVSITSIQALGTSSNVQEALQTLSEQITAGDVSIDSSKGAFFTDDSIFTVSTEGGHTMGVKTTGYIGTTENGINLVASKVDTAGSSTEASDLATVKTVTTYIGSEIGALDVDPLTLATIAANEITIAKIEEVNGKIGVSGTTAINVDGTVSSSNPLVTKSSITTAIGSLDVDGYVQGTVTGSAITVYGIKEVDGKIGSDTTKNLTIELGSNYNASSNKVALQSNITDAINALDVDTVQAVTYTAASGDDGVKLTFTGIKEEDGKIAVGTSDTELTFAKVATSGTAADVAIADTGNKYTATDVEGALLEVKNDIAALAGGMRYNGGISSATAAVNSSTGDIRPGDIYLATGTFSIGDTTVEAGDMIVYKGTQSSSAVTLTSENCNVIERETDTMVTTGDTLTANQIVFGNGNKAVAISTITKTDLLDAMTNANSALQSIGTGTDSGHVTTNVSAKSNNTQNVSVTLKESDVTYDNGTLSATDGVLTDDAITPIKNYVDYKVGTIVNSLDKPVTEVTGMNVKVKYEENDGIVTIGTITETYAGVANDLTVTTPTGLVTGADIEKVKTYIGTLTKDLDKGQTTTNGTNVHVTYSETDGIVTINSVTEDYATVQVSTSADPTLTVSNAAGLVVGSDIKNVKDYVDAKISTSINALDADVTSNNNAVATVQVVETNGKITGVNVTNVSAGVTVSTATPSLSASTATGAVTGADIDTIKQYVDAKAAQSAAVSDTLSTITVNSGEQTEIATIGGTPIHSAVSLVWEQYN